MEENNIKNRLKQFLEYLDIGQGKFESNCEISNGTVNNIKNGLSSPIIKKISTRYPELNLEWLIIGEGSMLKETDEKQYSNETEKSEGLPLIPFEYIAGYGEDNTGIILNDCEHYNIPEFENIGAEFLVRVGGSSMYPKYSSGDILACRKIPREDITFFQWGKVYVIDSAQGQIIKRIFEHENEDKIWLVSDNVERYPKFAISKEDIRTLSIVVGAVRVE